MTSTIQADGERSRPRSLVVWVSADPRVSTRPAEALRLAAGLAGWREVDVAVVLESEAVRVVEDPAHSLCDGDGVRAAMEELASAKVPMLSWRPLRADHEVAAAGVRCEVMGLTGPGPWDFLWRCDSVVHF